MAASVDGDGHHPAPYPVGFEIRADSRDDSDGLVTEDDGRLDPFVPLVLPPRVHVTAAEPHRLRPDQYVTGGRYGCGAIDDIDVPRPKGEFDQRLKSVSFLR